MKELGRYCKVITTIMIISLLLCSLPVSGAQQSTMNYCSDGVSATVLEPTKAVASVSSVATAPEPTKAIATLSSVATAPEPTKAVASVSSVATAPELTKAIATLSSVATAPEPTKAVASVSSVATAPEPTKAVASVSSVATAPEPSNTASPEPIKAAALVTPAATVPASSKGTTFEEKEVKISTGIKKLKIIRVNPKDPGISFEVNIPGGRLNNTEDFEKQVKDKKAFAAVNGNFFDAYGKIKDPIGHIMVDGKLVYGQSGLTTVGITYDKDIIFSKPGTFAAGTTDGKSMNEKNPAGGWNYYKWTAFEINTRVSSGESVTLYTPERGKSIDIPENGYVSVIEDGIIKENYFLKAPAIVKIPSNGYIVFYGEKAAKKQLGYTALQAGRAVDYKYFLFTNTNKVFSWEKMQWAVSGGPDLIVDGKIAPPSTHVAFSGERFTTLSTSRTVIAVTKNKQLMLVSVASARINELKEIMKALGAYQAINLDGGGSTAMYYNGKVLAKPIRKLVTILYVYKK